jgi:hypothetical protein
MDSEPHRFGLSANRLSAMTGVRYQTRDRWAQRGLLRKAPSYGELDLIEQLVLKALLATIPKSHVDLVWEQVRGALRGIAGHNRAALVWDSELRQAKVTRSDAALSNLVRHGRPVYVLPLGEIASQARAAYRAEARAAKRAAQARAQAANPPTSTSLPSASAAPSTRFTRAAR